MLKIGYSSKRYTLVLLLIFLFVASPAAWADITHTVKNGESLSTIARKYRVSISKIKEANDLEDTRLQIGQCLTIPQTPAPVSTSSSSRTGNQQNTASGQEVPDTYGVRSGDTLAGIAKRFHLTVKDLQEINELKGTRLRIGQVLRLKPEEKVSEAADIQTGEGSYESALAAKDGSAIPISQGADVFEERDLNPLVAVAEGFLGVKYRRGGTNVKTGLDCSAYVQRVFRMVGMDLPRTAREQFAVGVEVAREALRLGDLVFFTRSKTKRPAHVGIYIGNDQFIHTSTTKRKVRVDSLNTRYFSTRFIGARRIQDCKEPQEASKPETDDSQISSLAFEPAWSIAPASGSHPPGISSSPEL